VVHDLLPRLAPSRSSDENGIAPDIAVRAVAPPATSDDDGGISRPFNFQHVVHVKVNPDSPQGFEVAESMLPFTDVRVHALLLP